MAFLSHPCQLNTIPQNMQPINHPTLCSLNKPQNSDLLFTPQLLFSEKNGMTRHDFI